MAGEPPFEVKVKWMDQHLTAALNRSLSEPSIRTIATATMERIGKRVADDMRRALQAHGKVDTGQLRNAIDFAMEGRRGQQTLRVGPRARTNVTEPYDAVIEFGRRPGSKMPPAGVLLPWMQRHGIPAEAEFPIRRKIAASGLAGQPFPYLDTGWEAAQAGIENDMEGLLDAVRIAWNNFRG